MPGSTENSPLSPVFQASYTNGASGTPTYAWETMPTSASMSFSNPLNASSQRVRVLGLGLGQTGIAEFRCKITDAQANISYTPVATASYERND